MFSGRWGHAGIEALEARQLLTVTLDPVGDVSYPGGKSIFVPINGTTTGTSPLGYQVSTSDGRISARVLQNITFVDMNISIGGVAQTPIRLALFGDIAPVTVGRFLQLVNSGFYNGLKFHRIIPGFMAQGGDPLGTGTGGSGTRINDEYNAEAIFSTTGLLAMANSNNGSMNDTNDSQFFITAAQTRWLDFRHTIFGQMISGQATFNAMMAAGSSDGTPTRTVVITSAAVVQDLDTTVLVVKGPANVPGQVTITASSAAGSASRTFNVTGANDSANNDPPFLNPLQDVSIAYWQTATVTPTGTDLEGDGLFYASQVATSDTNHIDVARDDSGTYTIIPKPGFVGTAHVLFGVYRPATPTAAASWDTQWIAVTVTGPLSLDSSSRTVKVSGSDGNDKVTLSVSGGMLVAKLGSYTQRFALGDFDKVVVDLGDGDDSLTASAAVPPMVVSAGAGNDTIRGGGSGDTIYGQAGDDSIRGNGGDDWIEGGTGDDRITGDAGNDKLLGGDGFDWIQGGIGNDWIEGGAAAGMLYGGSGNDTVIGAEGDDTIFGDAGDDQLWARGGGDSVRGGTGNDSLWGEDGADLLRGDAGNDSLDGGLIADTLYGGSGNDTLRGGEDGDSLLGESGNDQAYGAAGDDTILGSSGNDTLLGEDGADLIRGDAGNDSIDGGIANDTLYGGAGNDSITGGPGSDSILGEAGIDYLYVQDDGGIDNVDGGKGLDHAQKDDADVLLNVEDGALIQA